MLIANGRLLAPEGVFEGKALLIRGGKIAAICDAADAPADDFVIDAKGQYVAPGLIDLHVHGAAGGDFCDGTYDEVCHIARFYARCGVTGLCATIASCPVPQLHQALAALREAMQRGTGGSAIIGAHLEGPFFNPARKGCHLGKYLRRPTSDQYQDILEQRDVVKHITLAPELDGALECIRRLAAAGIVVSGGHSNATAQTILDAIRAGMTHTTHLWSAMSGVTKDGPYRHAGIVETILLDDRLTTEIIADGHHLPAELMKLAFKCKGRDRLCLVSDAMRGTGMPAGGQYTFGGRDGQIAIMEPGVAVMPDRSGFASSTTPLNRIVATAIRMMGISLADAIHMASLTPARVLRIDATKGSLEAGKDADVVVFDDPAEVTCTIVAGQVAWERG
jgi:N-acetylglucosamine-6-phosphate deacetylase